MKLRHAYFVVLIGVVGLAWAPCSRCWAQSPAAVYAGRYVAPDGTLRSHAIVEISQGKISRVREGEAATPDIEVQWPDAVLCPGLIDVRCEISAYGNVIESAHSIDPGASAIDSVDFNHRDFRAVVRSGVTTVMITPAANNLISGASVVVKTARTPRSGTQTVVLREGPLMMALGSSVWSYDRAPTSRIGSLSMLRSALDEARAGRGHQRLQMLVQGRTPCMFVCEQAMDVSAALRTMKEYHIRGTVVHTGDEHGIAEELRGYGVGVVIGPYNMGMSPHQLSTASAYAESGVPIAFTAAAPLHHAVTLRITAALAVRHGLDPAIARKAITVTPALMVGVSSAVGSIHEGLDADLVVFSDDPLRLDARVLEVYIKGVRVYDARFEQVKSHGATP